VFESASAGTAAPVLSVLLSSSAAFCFLTSSSAYHAGHRLSLPQLNLCFCTEQLYTELFSGMIANRPGTKNLHIINYGTKYSVKINARFCKFSGVTK